MAAVTIRAGRGHREPSLDRAPMHAIEIALHMLSASVALSACSMLLMTVAADLDDIEREGAGEAIGFGQDVVSAVTGRTGGCVGIAFCDRLGVGTLEKVGVGRVVAACIAAYRAHHLWVRQVFGLCVTTDTGEA